MIQQLSAKAQTRGAGASSSSREGNGPGCSGPPPIALFQQAPGCSEPDLQQPELPPTWFQGRNPPRPPRGHVAGAARVPQTPWTFQAWNRRRGSAGIDPENGMLGCETHFLWALSFLALVLFFRAWSASTAGERDGWRANGEKRRRPRWGWRPSRGARPGRRACLRGGSRPRAAAFAGRPLGGLAAHGAQSSAQAGRAGGGSGRVRELASSGRPRRARAGPWSGPKPRAGLAGNKGRWLPARKDARAEGRGPAAQKLGVRGGATSVERCRTPGDRTATVRRSSRRWPGPRPRRPLPLVAGGRSTAHLSAPWRDR